MACANISCNLYAQQRSITQIKSASNTNGFTLIELIVVMLIMSIVLSLVGPLTLRMLDRAESQSEFISFKNSIKKVSYMAFASATEYSFQLDKNSLLVYKANVQIQQTQFELSLIHI